MIFHIPHASTLIPAPVREAIELDNAALETELAQLTDWYSDALFTPAMRANDVAVTSPVSRLVVDVERFAADAREPMAEIGMGAVYTHTVDGGPLRRSLTSIEHQTLIDRYYKPHHERLTAAVDAEFARHGVCLLIDCHTFPGQPLPCDSDQRPGRPDICIGTDPWHTADQEIEALLHGFAREGLTVGLNRPYAGSIVPLKHYEWSIEMSSVMVEVNRDLYLRPGTTQRNDRFDDLVGIIDRVVGRLREVERWDRSGPRCPVPYAR